MSLLRKNSNSNRQNDALNESHILSLASDLSVLNVQEDRRAPILLNRAYEQYNDQHKPELPTSSNPVVSRSKSTRYSALSLQRPVPTQTLSTDDLKRHHNSLPSLQTPSNDQKKSKGFFDRMRTSSNRLSTTEIRPCTPSLNGNTPTPNRKISIQESSPVFRSTRPSSAIEGPRIEWETYRFPSSFYQSSLLNETFKPDIFNQSELVYPAVSLHQTDHSESESSLNKLSHEEPRHRHQLRDSVLNPFLKLPNRYSAQSCTVVNSSSQVSPIKREFHRHHNSETISQVSLISQEDQSSVSTDDKYLDHSEHQLFCFSQNTFTQLETQLMAPPGGLISNRRIPDTNTTMAMQQSGRDGLPSNSNRSSQTQSHRTASQRDLYNTSQNEQGQSVPPTPAATERDINDNYKELVTKYKKVKGLYFEKTAQVEQLQNTLANQRLSQSRTSLDDSEYMTRFQRLEGAVTNLAFNIRKDWRRVPSWLSQFVNHDAMSIGKQEMTAVGRAVITKFLVDEIFDRTFHPGLSSEFSHSLKVIEQNIRKFCPAHNNQEESEALTAKVVQWRLTTLDGLKDVLTPPQSEQNKAELVNTLTERLTSVIANFLHEPKPAGVEDSAHMIVELAVSITANLPLESREISIVYPMPGAMLQSTIMKLENPIPPLLEPVGSSDDVDSMHSGDRDENNKEKKGHGILLGMSGGGSSSGKKEGGFDVKKGEDLGQKIRFSGFVGVEVRGRQVLYKAPVWSMS